MLVRQAGGRLVLGALGVLTSVVCLGAFAWACTGQPRFVGASVPTGPARATVAVRGEGAVPSAPVEIRWNGVNGTKLATATADVDGNFQASVTIPEASPGIYSLVAGAGGTTLGRTAFEVTATTARSATPSSPARWSARPASADDPSGYGSQWGFRAGAILLGVGLVGLFSASTALTVMSRRRAAASSTR
ncbi:MAG TPA: hypothetical protein VK988_00890 [Acidimicrobiales bacterium]|nr:hypothetical protein [Acidimicrobiales bacterium]